ncbi:MAG: energy transducer TonB [Thermodesulfobacteriota bacterium]
MQAVSTWLSGMETETRRLTIFLLISTAGHLLAIILLMVIPNLSSSRDYSQPFISVDLVPMAAPGPPPGDTLRPAPPKKEAVLKKPAAEVKQPAQPAVVEKPPAMAFKPKTSLKKSSYDKSKVIDSAVTRVKAKVDKAGADKTGPDKEAVDSYAETLERLARKLQDVEPERPGRFGLPGGTGGGGGNAAFGPLEIYKAEIIFYIQKNWAFSEQLAGDRKELEALLGVKIMPNGEIREFWFDKRSGNQYLDESAEKALLKSSPLPPLPSGFREPFLNVGLRFTPAGLQ